MKESLICLRCPLGCPLEAEHDGRCLVAVSGQRCKKGVEHAEREIFHPERIVTTTVRLEGAAFPLLPVRTRGAVPRERTFAVVEAASRLTVRAPVRLGQVLIAGVAGTGVDLVASCSVVAAGSGAAAAPLPVAAPGPSPAPSVTATVRRRRVIRRRRRKSEEGTEAGGAGA